MMKRLLPWQERYPLPPHLITMKVAKRAGAKKDLNRPGRALAAAAGHLGYGAGAGAFYGLLAGSLPGPAPLKGIAFALGVWTGSYLGWLPLAGLFDPATDQPARRNVLMITAHLVWGAVMGLFTEYIHNSGQDQRNGKDIGKWNTQSLTPSAPLSGSPRD